MFCFYFKKGSPVPPHLRHPLAPSANIPPHFHSLFPKQTRAAATASNYFAISIPQPSPDFLFLFRNPTLVLVALGRWRGRLRKWHGIKMIPLKQNRSHYLLCFFLISWNKLRRLGDLFLHPVPPHAQKKVSFQLPTFFTFE